jgi:hypothetical protein
MIAKVEFESTPKDNYFRALIVFWSVTWTCLLSGLLLLKFT